MSAIASRVANRGSGFSLPVAADEAFGLAPQSGLTWLCFLLPRRPGELRPEPLTDPCLTVSGHTARATPGRPAPSAETIGFLPLLVDSCRSRLGDPPSFAPRALQPSGRYYGAVRPCSAHRYCRPRGASAWAFSLSITDQVLKFRTKARMRVTPLKYTGHRMAVSRSLPCCSRNKRDLVFTHRDEELASETSGIQ